MMTERWHKEDVALTWKSRKTGFAVAQELFSSHEVDVAGRRIDGEPAW